MASNDKRQRKNLVHDLRILCIALRNEANNEACNPYEHGLSDGRGTSINLDHMVLQVEQAIKMIEEKK